MMMAKKADDKFSFDAHLMEIYLTGLQAEVEAKVRRVAKFREEMKRIDASGRTTDMEARRRTVDALITQVHDMLATNLIVRETLQELLQAAEAVRKDIEELEE
jgi:hypothetical protein